MDERRVIRSVPHENPGKKTQENQVFRHIVKRRRKQRTTLLCSTGPTFDQGADGHQSVLLHAPRPRRALEHPQQRRHHHVRDLQSVLVLHLPQDVLVGADKDTGIIPRTQG